MWQYGRVVWVTGALGLGTATAHAQGRGQPQEPPSERAANADEEARGFFIAGRAAFAAGRYREALERFERSHAMSGRPELLYNIGSAAERAGELGRSLEAYTAFVSALPSAERRPEAEARISALRARLTRGEPASAGQTPRTQPAAGSPDEHAGPASDTAGVPSATPGTSERTPAPAGLLVPASCLGGAGAVLVGGATLLGLGLAARARVEDAPDGATYSDYADDFRRAPRFENAGVALLSVGAVAAGLSTWWLVRRRAARVSVAVGPLQLGLRGVF